jgi:protein associated with RNAse G/E
MELASEKWGGRPHYRGEVVHLGDDEHGSWWWGAAGRTIFRGEEALFVTDQDALFLLVDGAWWSPTWWLGHPEVECYVNIGTPYELGDRLVTTDLDLDVILWCDGRVETVDQDEFALHQVQYGYPAEVVERVARTAAEVHVAVERRDPPFDGVAARAWTARARGG